MKFDSQMGANDGMIVWFMHRVRNEESEQIKSLVFNFEKTLIATFSQSW